MIDVNLSSLAANSEHFVLNEVQGILLPWLIIITLAENISLCSVVSIDYYIRFSKQPLIYILICHYIDEKVHYKKF